MRRSTEPMLCAGQSRSIMNRIDSGNASTVSFMGTTLAK